MNSKSKGDISVAKILTKLLESGKGVATPWGDNQLYDLILDDGRKLSKVQCKTGRIRKDRLIFNTDRVYVRADGSAVRQNYSNAIDYWGVYCPDNNVVYLIPYNDVPDGGKASLRMNNTRYRNQYGYKLASQYSL